MDDEEDANHEKTTSLPLSPVPKRTCCLLINTTLILVPSLGLNSPGQLLLSGLTPREQNEEGEPTIQVDSSDTPATSGGTVNNG